MMNVQLKLYATLGKYLPPNAKRNAVDLTVEETASVLDVLSAHNVPMETCHLILVNGVFSPPANAASARLKDGDTVAVWPPVAGG